MALVAEKAQTTEYKSSKEQESHASQDNTCSQKELGKSTIQIVDDTSHEDNPYGFERVYLGAGTRGGRDAYWEFGHRICLTDTFLSSVLLELERRT